MSEASPAVPSPREPLPLSTVGSSRSERRGFVTGPAPFPLGVNLFPPVGGTEESSRSRVRPSEGSATARRRREKPKEYFTRLDLTLRLLVHRKVTT